ncbi:hypothetical protein [Streptomyces antibioticus]|uniref:hypothetical protein n=1 Tax=Streptomyces antibioticus TaxID=1890 RepID=UPI003F4BDBD6
MTVPTPRRRRFDLRVTALFFVLLALLLSLGALLARTAAAAAERRPAWAVILLLLGSAGLIACHRGRRRWSTRTVLRRAGAALEEAAETAADALDEKPFAGSGGVRACDSRPVRPGRLHGRRSRRRRGRLGRRRDGHGDLEEVADFYRVAADADDVVVKHLSC